MCETSQKCGLIWKNFHCNHHHHPQPLCRDELYEYRWIDTHTLIAAECIYSQKTRMVKERMKTNQERPQSSCVCDCVCVSLHLWCIVSVCARNTCWFACMWKQVPYICLPPQLNSLSILTAYKLKSKQMSLCSPINHKWMQQFQHNLNQLKDAQLQYFDYSFLLLW